MKKIFTICVAVMLTAKLLAQAPEKISYQAIVRNASNELVTSTTVGMQVSILQGAANGSSVYVEKQNPTTNANGLLSLEIGTGLPVSGNFNAINWAIGPFFIKTEIDPLGATNYTISGTSQLISVPYALYAKSSGNGLKNGTAEGQIMYWNGVDWVMIPPGSNNQTLSFCSGIPTWGPCPAVVSALNCSFATTTGSLIQGTQASNVITTVSYEGGNGRPYPALSIPSKGVIGLTASLDAGTLANGSANLNFTITGTPSTSGTATFSIMVGGYSCIFTITVGRSAPQYPAGTVHCSGTPTAIVNVTNPTTGKIWMDRNLGALQTATSSIDEASYGDLYQWGRRSDGHQCRNSGTTNTLSSTDQPSHGNFILSTSSYPYDWRKPQNNDLWQGVNGVNNPCPSSYRVPTLAEFESERVSWSSNSSVGAIASSLKLPLPGRNNGAGPVEKVGSVGFYWSSTVITQLAGYLVFDVTARTHNYARAGGMAVRCLRD